MTCREETPARQIRGGMPEAAGTRSDLTTCDAEDLRVLSYIIFNWWYPTGTSEALLRRSTYET
jgi:hypothetical protein